MKEPKEAGSLRMAMEALVAPHYAEKDSMHGLAHIARLLRSAFQLMERHPADQAIVTAAAYLHGLAAEHRLRLAAKLADLGFDEVERGRILQAARESQKEESPQSREGIILHDAHLIEGGPTFLLVKSLVTGTERGQSLEETLTRIEHDILGRYACCLPEAQALYAEKERYAGEAISSLKAGLAR